MRNVWVSPRLSALDVKAAKGMWRFGKTPAKKTAGKRFRKEATSLASLAEVTYRQHNLRDLLSLRSR